VARNFPEKRADSPLPPQPPMQRDAPSAMRSRRSALKSGSDSAIRKEIAARGVFGARGARYARKFGQTEPPIIFLGVANFFISARLEPREFELGGRGRPPREREKEREREREKRRVARAWHKGWRNFLNEFRAGKEN